ncbi:hypothetical protein GCM10022221_67560 [Actinocorallia aurea]
MTSSTTTSPIADHEWLLAAQIPASHDLIQQANRTGSVYTAGTFVEVTGVYCKHCRLEYSAAFDGPCDAPRDNTHLIGGRADGSRAKRKHRGHDCFALGCNTAEVVAARQQAAARR